MPPGAAREEAEGIGGAGRGRVVARDLEEVLGDF